MDGWSVPPWDNTPHAADAIALTFNDLTHLVRTAQHSTPAAVRSTAQHSTVHPQCHNSSDEGVDRIAAAQSTARTHCDPPQPNPTHRAASAA